MSKSVNHTGNAVISTIDKAFVYVKDVSRRAKPGQLETLQVMADKAKSSIRQIMKDRHSSIKYNMSNGSVRFSDTEFVGSNPIAEITSIRDKFVKEVESVTGKIEYVTVDIKNPVNTHLQVENRTLRDRIGAARAQLAVAQATIRRLNRVIVTKDADIARLTKERDLLIDDVRAKAAEILRLENNKRDLQADLLAANALHATEVAAHAVTAAARDQLVIDLADVTLQLGVMTAEKDAANHALAALQAQFDELEILQQNTQVEVDRLNALEVTRRGEIAAVTYQLAGANANIITHTATIDRLRGELVEANAAADIAKRDADAAAAAAAADIQRLESQIEALTEQMRNAAAAQGQSDTADSLRKLNDVKATLASTIADASAAARDARDAIAAQLAQIAALKASLGDANDRARVVKLAVDDTAAKAATAATANAARSDELDRLREQLEAVTNAKEDALRLIQTRQTKLGATQNKIDSLTAALNDKTTLYDKLVLDTAKVQDDLRAANAELATNQTALDAALNDKQLAINEIVIKAKERADEAVAASTSSEEVLRLQEDLDSLAALLKKEKNTKIEFIQKIEAGADAIVRLTKELAAVRARLESESSVSKAASEKIGSMRTEIDGLLAQIARHNNVISEKDATAEGLQRQLDAANKELETLKGQSSRNEIKGSELSARITALKEQVASLQAVQIVPADNSGYSDMASIEMIQLKNDKIEALKVAMRELDGENIELKERIDTLAGELGEHTKLIAAKNSEITRMQTDITGKEEQIANFEEQIRLLGLRPVVPDLSAKVQELENQLGTTQGNYTTYLELYNDEHNKNADLLLRIKALEKNLRELSASYGAEEDRLTGIINGLKTENSELVTKYAKLSDDLSRNGLEYKALLKDHHKSKARYEMIRMTFDLIGEKLQQTGEFPGVMDQINEFLRHLESMYVQTNRAGFAGDYNMELVGSIKRNATQDPSGHSFPAIIHEASEKIKLDRIEMAKMDAKIQSQAAKIRRSGAADHGSINEMYKVMGYQIIQMRKKAGILSDDAEVIIQGYLDSVQDENPNYFVDGHKLVFVPNEMPMFMINQYPKLTSDVYDVPVMINRAPAARLPSQESEFRAQVEAKLAEIERYRESYNAEIAELREDAIAAAASKDAGEEAGTDVTEYIEIINLKQEAARIANESFQDTKQSLSAELEVLETEVEKWSHILEEPNVLVDVDHDAEIRMEEAARKKAKNIHDFENRLSPLTVKLNTILVNAVHESYQEIMRAVPDKPAVGAVGGGVHGGYDGAYGGYDGGYDGAYGGYNSVSSNVYGGDVATAGILAGMSALSLGIMAMIIFALIVLIVYLCKHIYDSYSKNTFTKSNMQRYSAPRCDV
jgi:chromosome segregation ATPase